MFFGRKLKKILAKMSVFFFIHKQNYFRETEGPAKLIKKQRKELCFLLPKILDRLLFSQFGYLDTIYSKHGKGGGIIVRVLNLCQSAVRIF